MPNRMPQDAPLSETPAEAGATELSASPESVSVKQDEPQTEEALVQTQEEMDAINRVHRDEWVQAAASRFGALPWDMHAALRSADLEYATEDEAEKALKKYLKRDIP